MEQIPENKAILSSKFELIRAKTGIRLVGKNRYCSRQKIRKRKTQKIPEKRGNFRHKTKPRTKQKWH